MTIISMEKIFLIERDLISSKLDILSPTYENIKKQGAKPIKDDKKNLNFEISKVDINKFCTIRGIPNISLINIKYSYDDFFIILFSLSVYFER